MSLSCKQYQCWCVAEYQTRDVDRIALVAHLTGCQSCFTWTVGHWPLVRAVRGLLYAMANDMLEALMQTERIGPQPGWPVLVGNEVIDLAANRQAAEAVQRSGLAVKMQAYCSATHPTQPHVTCCRTSGHPGAHEDLMTDISWFDTPPAGQGDEVKPDAVTG